MSDSDKVIEIIEDHVRVTDYLDQLCCAIENPKIELPNFVPVCNDSLVTDRLTTIAEHVKDLRKKLL